MTSPTTSATASSRRGQFEALDIAVYAAIATTETPDLDREFSRLSRAADHSKLWIVSAVALAATGGEDERRAAVDALVAVAVTSAVTNLVFKPLSRRRRPDRDALDVPSARHVTMPESTSFPSGHAASAFAFASSVSHSTPRFALPVEAAAAVVSYSRVHTGVHYPIDVIAGALIGSVIASMTAARSDRRRAKRSVARGRPPHRLGATQ